MIKTGVILSEEILKYGDSEDIDTIIIQHIDSELRKILEICKPVKEYFYLLTKDFATSDPDIMIYHQKTNEFIDMVNQLEKDLEK